MRQQLWLDRCGEGEAVAQNLSDTTVQHLTPTPEQIVIRCVLNESVLEAIATFRRQSLDQQDVSLCEPLKSCLQWHVLHPGNGANERVGEISSNHRADLRDLARWAKSVEPRRQGLLQCRRDRMGATVLAAL